MNLLRYRPSFQSLESRRLLAADIGVETQSIREEVTAIIAADVNADGTVTPSDALQVINELNAASVFADAIAATSEALDVNGDGSLSALDALRVINRLQTEEVDVIDSVMRMIPEREGIVDSIETNLRDSISSLIEQLNVLRSQVQLPRAAVADVVGEIADLVRDDSLSATDRTGAILNRVTNIVETVGLDASDVRRVVDRVQVVIESLPSSLTNTLEEIDEDILAAAERIVDSLDGGLSLSSVGALVSNLRDLDLTVRLPSLASLFDFVDVYRRTTADRSFNDAELLQLRESAGSVLSSAGIEGELRDDLLDGFDRIIRLRF